MCRRVLPAFALLPLFAAKPASAIVFQNTTAQSAGLGAGQSFLDAEAELIVTLSDGSLAGCSGSLLSGGYALLTAAHCVTGDNDTLSATDISVNFANVNLSLTSQSYVVDPLWNGSLANGGDLAVIQFSTPITSISGYQLDTTSSAVGDKVTLAGYGLTGVGSTGYTANTFGTLYEGTNQYLGVYSNAQSVYAYGFTSGTSEVMIAPGDSGGASLVNVGGVWEIVGVHDFVTCFAQGCTPNSSFGQFGGDTSVYADAAFLDTFVVPEPRSAALMGVSVFGLIIASRLRPGMRSRRS
jgi:hypothetical protein